MTIPINEDLFCPNCAHKGMKAKPATHSKGSSPGARFLCPACHHRTRTALYTAPQILPKVRVTEIKKHKRFIITSAVNDTELVTGAHETFKRMAKELNAAYCIIPGRYRNPNMMREGIHNFYTWPKEILDYVVNADVQLNKNLWIRGTWPIQYTAINPLSGLNHSGDTASEIFGHPQIAMEMVPTPADMSPKMLHTTGSISVKNYSSSKDGKKAEFHHVIGALFIEIEGDKFWPTQLRYDGEGVHLYDK